MPSLTRRSVVVGLGATAAVAGYSLHAGAASWLRTRLTEHFGPAIGEHADTARFVEDFLANLQRHKPDDYRMLVAYFRVLPPGISVMQDQEDRVLASALGRFCVSSNAIAAYETGEDFAYYGLFNPYRTPCLNQLGAAFAPEGASGSV